MNPPPITAIVVDDEPLALAGIARLLRPDPEIEIVAECIDGRQGVDAIAERKPDLVLLDVQLPELDGFEGIAAVGVERMPVVVFVTAYDRFAIKAFEAQALDYLVKPFDDERFRTAIARAKRAVRQRTVAGLERRLVALLEQRESAAERGEQPVARLVLREAGRVQFIPSRDIDWIEAANYYVKLHVGDRTHLLRESMTSIAGRLGPAGFSRLHKSAIVNLRRVRTIHPSEGGDGVVVLLGGARLPLARGRRDLLESTLSGWAERAEGQ